MASPETNEFGSFLSNAVQSGLYSNNPFRILEIPMDCSEHEITKRQKIIEIATKKNMKIPPGSCRVMPVEDGKDIYSYNDAVQRLLDPEKRFVNEYFWFWPEKFGKSSQDEALQALKEGETESAVDIWTNTASHVSTHNLAIYSHLKAIENETSSLEEVPSPTKAKKIATYWSQSYKRWTKLVQDDEHWDYVRKRIRELSDPRLPVQSADQMRTSLPYMLLYMNANLAVQAAEKAVDSETIDRQLQVIQGSEFEPSLQQKAILSSLTSIQERAENVYRTNGCAG